MHVVHVPTVARHDVQDLRDEARTVLGGDVRRVGPGRRREVPEVRTHEVERARVVVGDVVDEPARHRDPGTTEVLLGDRFAHRLQHDRRACSEDRRAPAHHREVGHRRDERAVTGRRAEHRGHERHPARAQRLGEQVRRRPGVPAPVGAEPGALQDHDQRHPVGDRQLGDAVPLRVGGLADRSGLHREVLGGDHHRASVDPARPHHHRIGRRVVPAHQGAELLERTRVEEMVDARPGVELPGAAVLRQPLVAAHGARRAAAFLQVLQDLVPLGAIGPGH